MVSPFFGVVAGVLVDRCSKGVCKTPFTASGAADNFLALAFYLKDSIERKNKGNGLFVSVGVGWQQGQFNIIALIADCRKHCIYAIKDRLFL